MKNEDVLMNEASNKADAVPPLFKRRSLYVGYRLSIGL